MAMDTAALNAQNQGPTILALCWILVMIPGLVLGLRIWCKTALSNRGFRGFGLDDMIVALAWVCLHLEAKLHYLR